MSGKVKSLHGVYKALGRDAFLAAAKMYSTHVQKTVEATLSQMESHWYDAAKTVTEAEEMVNDYNFGFLTKERATELLEQERLQERFTQNMNAVLKNVHFVRLECSCMSPNKSYAGEVLKEMHGAFVKTYGTDYLDNGSYEFVSIPAVIRSRCTGKLCLGIVTLDLSSSGEHTASAMQKNSQAQYLLAKLYLCEDGIPKDAEKALHWLWESVKQKNQYAQYLLGKMLLFGKETDRDVETGIALLSASAEQGNVYAARLLQSYYSGRLRNPSIGMASFRLLSQLTRMFTDRLRRNEDGQRAVIERKLRQKIEEKKQAHGMKMG